MSLLPPAVFAWRSGNSLVFYQCLFPFLTECNGVRVCVCVDVCVRAELTERLEDGVGVEDLLLYS